MKSPDSDIIQEAARRIGTDLQMAIANENWDEASLVRYLTPLIRTMLDKDFNRFLLICYRVDIDEKRLKSILAESSAETLAEDLARELVARQVQKIQLRRKYSGY